MIYVHSDWMLFKVQKLLGDSFSLLKHACLDLIQSYFCLRVVVCGGHWIGSPHIWSKWV